MEQSLKYLLKFKNVSVLTLFNTKNKSDVVLSDYTNLDPGRIIEPRKDAKFKIEMYC